MERSSLITILGAGAAGIGVAVALKRLGMDQFQVIDKGKIGQSFRHWNKYTRFITPSFNTSGFGFPDLNAITPNTSPGMSAGKEHLSGPEYASYLEEVAAYFDVTVHTQEEIIGIQKTDEGFKLWSKDNQYYSKYLILAVGDLSFPNTRNLKGAEHGVLYADLGDYSRLGEASEYAIIGGNESGFDAAIQLAKQGKRSVMYARHASLDSESSDPSLGLSLYTRERYHAVKDRIRIVRGVRMNEILVTDEGFQLVSEQGERYATQAAPIVATGFAATQSPLINNLFEVEGNRAVLTGLDESTLHSNLFMVGPQVEHGQVVLCFIYKFRQRFAVIIDEIASREGLELRESAIQDYLDNQMYLTDLDSCGTDCVC
ncbi:NAD(P)/FAD-dependent oxidoreductase [Fundicoccus culcitae]|uniref:NAD(P)-binding domain-containing protein n=1 Tax=Fundicoccus culcitae TaxID=2969821 RepID=A0ABY5P3I8_9LACT|nr:NAD(P)/FAD-dependent oxidoreductase [Fundicoccus culcitae]UUX33294.1 NAD(P)-binding domain-containing protein [Fundicoccus culcitae]